MIRVSRLLISSWLSNSGSTEAEHFIHPFDYGCIHAAAACGAVSAVVIRAAGPAAMIPGQIELTGKTSRRC
jgi:hypothetical protein